MKLVKKRMTSYLFPFAVLLVIIGRTFADDPSRIEQDHAKRVDPVDESANIDVPGTAQGYIDVLEKIQEYAEVLLPNENKCADCRESQAVVEKCKNMSLQKTPVSYEGEPNFYRIEGRAVEYYCKTNVVTVEYTVSGQCGDPPLFIPIGSRNGFRGRKADRNQPTIFIPQTMDRFEFFLEENERWIWSTCLDNDFEYGMYKNKDFRCLEGYGELVISYDSLQARCLQKGGMPPDQYRRKIY